MKTISYFLFSILIISCHGKSEADAKPMNIAKRPVEKIVSEVYDGNIASYQELQTIYLDMSPDEFLFWAMLMANKYDYGPAYLDAYYSMKDAYERGGEKFEDKDKMTKEFLMKYLKIAVERNVDGAKEEWESIGNR